MRPSGGASGSPVAKGVKREYEQIEESFKEAAERVATSEVFVVSDTETLVDEVDFHEDDVFGFGGGLDDISEV